ncbi:MAG: PKD domain-containing protein, partial [Bdellovibrionales bacterium]|nr:PKD domain-containing protein [Bdellovibrionales bacterium]
MKRSLIQSTLLALSSVLVFGCATAEKASPKMAEVTVNAKLTSDYGRSLVSSPRGNYMIVDSVPPLKGPNQELNPADMLLSSLATCALFVYEAEAAAAGKPMTSAMVTVQGDFNPKGILSDKINPKFQAFRIGVQAEGYTEEDFVDCDGNSGFDCYADFFMTPTDNELTVLFEDFSFANIGNVVAWEWDFGDGNTSTEQYPTHTYAEEGIYEVTLAITTDEGCTSSITLHVCLGEG